MYNYSKEMFKVRAKPMRKIDDPDNQRLDKWSSTVLTHTYITTHIHIQYIHTRTNTYTRARAPLISFAVLCF